MSKKPRLAPLVNAKTTSWQRQWIEKHAHRWVRSGNELRYGQQTVAPAPKSSESVILELELQINGARLSPERAP